MDVNKDGKLDLVEDGGVALGNGDGTFGALKPFPGGLGFGQPYPTTFSMHLAAGDLNGDGFPDIVASFVQPGMSPYAAEVFVLTGDGHGNFTANQLYDANLQVQQVVGIAVGVLRKGGPPSIVLANNVVNPSGGDLTNAVIFASDGAGAFTETAHPTPSIDAGTSGVVAIADFNHDGSPDIGFVTGGEFAVALGNGDGTFSASLAAFPIASGTQSNPAASMAVADFNGDGWPDVVLTNDQGLTRLYNQPVPTVSPGSLKFAASGTQEVTVENTLPANQPMSAGLAGGAQSPFRITANTCQGTLAPGARCSVTVEYATAGMLASDTLYIRGNGEFIAAVGLSGN